MHGLGIKSRREGFDVRGRNGERPKFHRVADLEILEGAHIRNAASGRKPEMHDVPIGDHVFLAFEAQSAGLAGARLASERDVIVIRDGFGADETALEVGVDDARGLGRLGAAGYGPGFRLLGSCREIREKA